MSLCYRRNLRNGIQKQSIFGLQIPRHVGRRHQDILRRNSLRQMENSLALGLGFCICISDYTRVVRDPTFSGSARVPDNPGLHHYFSLVSYITNNSAKCYYLNHGTNIKRSHKGTPKHIGLTASDYETALFQNKIRRAKFNRIVTDHRVGSSTTKSTEKRAVNPTYLKMHVGNSFSFLC